MTAKEYLMQYQKLTWDMERIDREIEAINESIDSIQGGYDGMPRSNKISKRPEEIAVKLSTLKEKKLAKQAKAWEKREEITGAVNKVRPTILSKLLNDRYIELMTWKDIAEDIDRSEYWTRTELHSQALTAIADIKNF